MSATNGPFTLTLNVPITIPDAGSAYGGQPSANVQLQNSSIFVISVLAAGLTYTIQAFMAVTIPLTVGPENGTAEPITVIPTQAISLLAQAFALTCVWLLPNEAPPMPDGPLTAAAIIAIAGGGGNQLVYDVRNYGATGNGITDDTAAIQTTFNALPANGGIVVFPAGYTFVWSSLITINSNFVVFAYGARLLWEGPSGVAGFTNAPGITMAWFGGTIDGNSLPNTQTLFEFGAFSNWLSECSATDIDFVNVTHGAWTANAVGPTGTDYNIHVRWRNLSCTKTPPGTDNGDMFELVGYDVEADVVGYDGGGTSYVITSSWLKFGKIRSFALSFAAGSVRNNILLQPYTGNGPQPNFEDVELEGNGQIGLNNGNLTAVAGVATSTEIVCHDAENVTLGNTPFDEWETVLLRGTMRPAGGGHVSIGLVKKMVGDIIIDGLGAGTPNLHSLIAIDVNAPLVTNVFFKSLTVKNISNLAYNYILGLNPSSVCQSLIVEGDISFNNTAPLYQAADLPNFGVALFRVIYGFNPVGVVVVAVPGSGTPIAVAPYDRYFYVTAAALGCTITTSGGPAVVIPAGALATIFVPAAQYFTPTYTNAPTWTVEGV
jgi:Pectate lyase superfamily protein